MTQPEMRRHLSPDSRLSRLESEVEQLMSDVSDLQNAEQALSDQLASYEQTVTQAVTDLQAQVAALQAAGTDTAAIEAVVTQLQGLTATAATDQAAAAAADPGAPTGG